MYFEGAIKAQERAEAKQKALCGATSRCTNCPARADAICAGLAPEALDDLHQLSRHRVLRKGQTLVWQGDRTDIAATVISGMLKLSAATADGREQILGLVAPGGFVGRIDEARARYDIVALADTELCQFSGPGLALFASRHPEIASALLGKTMQELDRSRHWQLMLGQASAAERVATMLLDFAGADLEAGGCYPFPLSRGQMAELAGLTIETVSRQISQLKRNGVISVLSRTSFSVRDPHALMALAGLSPVAATH